MNKSVARTITPVATTPWRAVISVILAGIVAALHVGKAPIALPWMQAEFGRSLQSLSWLMSVFPLVGMIGGIAAGVGVRRWGDRGMLGAGLLTLAVASAAGAAAPSYAWLLGTRLAEGLGFLWVVVAAPTLLHRLTPPPRHALVFGLWSIFMASGMALSLLCGHGLGGWRRLWLVDAGLALLLVVPLATIAAAPPRPLESAREVLRGIRDTLGAGWPLLLALSFAVYALQFFAVLGFLPIFLIQRMGLSAGQAGPISAAVVAMNIIGNLCAGALLSRGVTSARLMIFSSIATGVTGAMLFLSVTPAALAVSSCFVFSATAGVLPPAVLASAPGAAPRPALAPLSLGLVMQGNYLGQALGPVTVGALVASAGWSSAAIPVVVAAVLGVVLGRRFSAMQGAGERRS